MARAKLGDDSPLGGMHIEFQNALTAPPLPTRLQASDREPAAGELLTSRVCREEDLVAPYHAYWATAMDEDPQFHRKQWEHTFIAQALAERGAFHEGGLGVGFGVGTEPLVALFASRGCSVIATDMPRSDPRHAGWERHGEYAASLEALCYPNVCSPNAFAERVEVRELDMNQSDLGIEGVDFCWSACALEHLGSLEAGLSFIERSLRTLKPGGIAVHTTEFNLSSDDATVEDGPTVLYRRRDLQRLADRLSRAGHAVAPLDLRPGDGWSDRIVDVFPYSGRPHTRTTVRDFICTSVGIIVTKAS